MLEITSNFKINLDLFEWATFFKNYGHQTAYKAITGCTKMALRYFGPMAAKRSLELINTLIFFSEKLIVQKVPDAKVQQIEI